MIMNEKKKILIIEDHDSIRLLLGNFLGKEFNVFTMKDGFDGLMWLSNGNIPDLILLDLDMPRVSGLEFLTNIRGSGFFAEIPVIVVSGKDSSELYDECHQFGIHEYLTKPFNPIKLKEMIGNAFQDTTSKGRRATI